MIFVRFSSVEKGNTVFFERSVSSSAVSRFVGGDVVLPLEPRLRLTAQDASSLHGNCYGGVGL